MSLSESISSISAPQVELSSSPIRKDPHLTKTRFLFAISLIAAIGGLALFFISRGGISLHCFDVISHVKGGLIVGTAGTFGLFFSSNKLLVNSVRARYLHRHFFKRLQQMNSDDFSSVLINTTLNTAKLSLLFRSREMCSKFIAMRSELIQNNGQSLEAYGCRAYTPTDILQQADQGVCFGYILVVAKRILSGEPIESICQKLSRGADAEIVALQFLYKTVPKKFNSEQAALAIQGLKNEDIDGTIEDEGVYSIILSGQTCDHTILIQVRGTHVFLLDPNFFLLRFDKSVLQHNIQEFLTLYYETVQKISSEDLGSQLFSIRKFSLNIIEDENQDL